MGELDLIAAEGVKPTRQPWMMDGLVPRGKLTVIDGVALPWGESE